MAEREKRSLLRGRPTVTSSRVFLGTAHTELEWTGDRLAAVDIDEDLPQGRARCVRHPTQEQAASPRARVR